MRMVLEPIGSGLGLEFHHEQTTSCCHVYLPSK